MAIHDSGTLLKDLLKLRDIVSNIIKVVNTQVGELIMEFFKES